MPGRCLSCGCSISTFLNLPAWCTRCAGFTSPIQKNELDIAAGVVVAAVTGGTVGAKAKAGMDTYKSLKDTK